MYIVYSKFEIAAAVVVTIVKVVFKSAPRDSLNRHADPGVRPGRACSFAAVHPPHKDPKAILCADVYAHAGISDYIGNNLVRVWLTQSSCE